MPLIAVNEIIDVTPWHGWEITHQPDDWQLGPLSAFGRRAQLASVGGRMTLTLDGRAVLATEIRGRFRHVEIAPGRLAFEPPLMGGKVIVPGTISRATYGSQTLAPQREGDETILVLPAVAAPQRCEIGLVP
ncbi:MAG: hypothetical protein JNL25_10785, partial [Rhodospirillaceae bacterium]|nr:hypothetical protein [Rhodospirillaceae bacterium]